MIQLPPGTRRVAVATDIWERLRETPSPAVVETVHRERSLHEDYIARIIAANRPETDV